MNGTTYILILKDTLMKKNLILDKLVGIVELQERCLDAYQMDLEQFEDTLSEKDNLIQQLNDFDDGFEKVYERVSEEINANKFSYKEDIIKLQELIRTITEKSTKIQGIEKKNKVKLESQFTKKKKEIKDFKVSSETVSSYYKNMANAFQGESYFLDKKK